MIFFPLNLLLLFLFFIFVVPLFLILAFLNVVSFSFEKLGFSPAQTFLLLLSILIGSSINIPLTPIKKAKRKETYFFGFVEIPVEKESGVFINLGGAVIPLFVSIYLLQKVPLFPTLISTFLMTLLCFFLARVIPYQGIVLPPLVPPVFSALFAIFLAPKFAPAVAFISGVLGTLIGADILNLPKVKKIGGAISIGGAGVFDGIFLVGIISVLLTAI